MEFADIIKSIASQNNRVAIHYGKVTALTNTNTRISVQVSGSSTAITGVRFLSSYTPTVNDIVLLLINKGDIVALGKLT